MLCYRRYITHYLLGPALFITLSLTGIIWLAQSLRFIDLIVNKGLSVSLFLYLTLLLMPSLLSVVLPVALFCAILYTYNKLNSDSELVVMESAGLSKAQLARPALTVAAAITCVSYLISLYMLPASFREFKDLQFYIRNNYASLLLQEGVFNSPTGGLTVYIRKRESNGVLKGILVHDNSRPAHPVTMMARQGYMMNGPDGPQIVLEQGNRQEINHENEQLSLLHFDSYAVNLNLFTKNEDFRTREPQERFLHELFTIDKDTPPSMLGKMWAEAHQRLTWPLYSFALSAVGLACLLSGDFNRRGQWRKLVIATLLGLGCTAMALAMQNLVAHSRLLTPLMYSIPIGITVAAFWVLEKQHLRKPTA